MDSSDLSVLFVAGILVCLQAEITEPCTDRSTTLRKGVILSPNYPQNYGNNLHCTWEIHLQNTGRIVLNFNDFKLEGTFLSKCYDFLTIIENENYQNHTLLDKHCGTSMMTKTVISSSDRIFVVFKSSFLTTQRGFNITWDACGGTFYNPTYPVTSPKSQFSHEPIICIFRLFILDNTSAIAVNFSQTNFRSYKGECLIEVFESDDTFYYEICSDTDRHIYIGNTNEITFNFKLIYQSNVLLNASFSKYECSEILTDTSGLLQSPNYPKPFGRNSVCDYTFNVTIPDDQLLEIRFNDLDVNCNGPDILEFYQYDSSDNISVIEVCTDNKTDILYMKNRISIRFLSTYDDYSARFSVNYSIIDEPTKNVFDAVNAETHVNKSQVPVIIGAVAGVIFGISAIAVLIGVTLCRRKREKPQTKPENIGIDVIYANNPEEIIQFQREQQATLDQTENAKQYTSNQESSERQFNLRLSSPTSRETGAVEANSLYAETDDGDYDVLRKARQKVVAEKGDNLYDISVKVDGQYDTTQRYSSPDIDSEDEMYDRTYQFHGNDNIYDKAGMC